MRVVLDGAFVSGLCSRSVAPVVEQDGEVVISDSVSRISLDRFAIFILSLLCIPFACQRHALVIVVYGFAPPRRRILRLSLLRRANGSDRHCHTVSDQHERQRACSTLHLSRPFLLQSTFFSLAQTLYAS